jgi:outer membrane protein assembly factor BamB
MSTAGRLAMVTIVLVAVGSCGGDSGDDEASPVSSSRSSTTVSVSRAVETTISPATTVAIEEPSTTPPASLAPGDQYVAPSEPGGASMVDGSSDASPPGEAFGDSVVVALGLDDGLALWTVQQTDELRGVSYPIGADDRVIVQTAWCGNNLVAALDAATGQMLWRTAPALPIVEHPSQSPPIVDEAGVLVTMAGQPPELSIVGIDTNNGEVAWTDSPSPDRGFIIAESPSIVAGWSVSLGTMWALDRLDGSELWSLPVGEPFTGGQSPPDMPYAVADGERLFVILGETMTAYQAMTAQPLWNVTNAAWAFPPSPLAADSGVVVTGSQEGVIAYDAASGEELWRLDDRMAIESVRPTSVADGNFYLNTGTGIAALDVTTGERRWDTSPQGAPPTVPTSTPLAFFGSDVVAAGHDRVLVRSGDGVQLLDAASGAVVWGPSPSNLATPFYTIGPDAVLMGKTCGGD